MTGLAMERLVSVDRHAKVIPGGRIFSFSALVVVGNGAGRIGIGYAAAREVPAAIAKAMQNARRSMVDIQLNNDTIFYPITFKYGATKLYMQPASQGTGIIAAGPLRAVCEVLGIHNLLSKIYGSTKPINVVHAAVDGLQSIISPQQVAQKRGKTLSEIQE